MLRSFDRAALTDCDLLVGHPFLCPPRWLIVYRQLRAPSGMPAPRMQRYRRLAKCSVALRSGLPQDLDDDHVTPIPVGAERERRCIVLVVVEGDGSLVPLMHPSPASRRVQWRWQPILFGASLLRALTWLQSSS